MTALFGPTLLRSLRVHGDSQSQKPGSGKLDRIANDSRPRVRARYAARPRRRSCGGDQHHGCAPSKHQRRSARRGGLGRWPHHHDHGRRCRDRRLRRRDPPAAGSLDGMAVRLMLVILGVMKRSGAPLGSITTKERLPLDEIEQIRL
jgi:hypothetical protein